MDTAKGSLRNLNWLIFLIASMQAGFGAFVPVHLTAGGWDPRAIGAVLSAGTIAAVAAQVPSGAVIDHFASKRGLAACAIVVNMVALLLLAAAPSFGSVMLAEIVQGAAGAGLSLAIPAITLSLSHQDALGERLGHNVRSAGSAPRSARCCWGSSAISSPTAPCSSWRPRSACLPCWRCVASPPPTWRALRSAPAITLPRRRGRAARRTSQSEDYCATTGC